jgi:hypothetical protein
MVTTSPTVKLGGTPMHVGRWGVGVDVGVGVYVGVAVAVGVGVNVGVAVAVGVGVYVAVGDAVGLGDDVGVAVADGIGVAVGVAVGVSVGTGVAVNVGSAVADGEGVGVALGVPLGSGVANTAWVAVTVSDGTKVPVSADGESTEVMGNAPDVAESVSVAATVGVCVGADTTAVSSATVPVGSGTRVSTGELSLVEVVVAVALATSAERDGGVNVVVTVGALPATTVFNGTTAVEAVVVTASATCVGADVVGETDDAARGAPSVASGDSDADKIVWVAIGVTTDSASVTSGWADDSGVSLVEAIKVAGAPVSAIAPASVNVATGVGTPESEVGNDLRFAFTNITTNKTSRTSSAVYLDKSYRQIDLGVRRRVIVIYPYRCDVVQNNICRCIRRRIHRSNRFGNLATRCVTTLLQPWLDSCSPACPARPIYKPLDGKAYRQTRSNS